MIEINHLEISVRAFNALKSDGITTIAALRAKSDLELLRIPNFGKVSFREVKRALAEWDKLTPQTSTGNHSQPYLPKVIELLRQTADALETLYASGSAP